MNGKQAVSVAVIPNGFQVPYIVELVRGLSSTGVRIDFLGSNLYECLRDVPGVNFFNMRGAHDHNASWADKVWRNLQYYARIFSYVRRTQVRIFHVQWLRFAFFDGVLILLLLRSLGKKVVYTAHNILPHGKDRMYNRLVFSFIYRIADVIFVHALFLKERLVRMFAIEEGKIHVIKHGVYNVLDDPLLTKDVCRQKLKIDTGAQVMLFFGNIARYKGTGLLLEAFSSCRRELPSLRMIMAGRVAGDFRKEFERSLDIHGAKDILLRTGREYVPDEEVELFFKAADIVMLPYEEGSQSGVLFLAYAYGRPVIASDVGGFSEDVQAGQTGMIFKSGDQQDLVCKIKAWFVDYHQQDHGREEAIKAFAQREYSWKDIGSELSRIYQKLSGISE
jgi:glycosyltransferase involved in cell wall biosynthesis